MTNADPEPPCVAAGCPCVCHDGEGADCDFAGCSFSPFGEPPSVDPEQGEIELAAPSLEHTIYGR